MASDSKFRAGGAAEHEARNAASGIGRDSGPATWADLSMTGSPEEPQALSSEGDTEELSPPASPASFFQNDRGRPPPEPPPTTAPWAKGQIAMKVKLEDLPAELLVRSVWVILGGVWEQLAATRRALQPQDNLGQTICDQIDRRLEEIEELAHQLDAWCEKRKAKEKREAEEHDWRQN